MPALNENPQPSLPEAQNGPSESTRVAMKNAFDQFSSQPLFKNLQILSMQASPAVADVKSAFAGLMKLKGEAQVAGKNVDTNYFDQYMQSLKTDYPQAFQEA